MMFDKRWLRSSFNTKHIIAIIAAISCLVAAMFLFSSQMTSLFDYMSFLKSRNYTYSVVVNKDMNENSYAYYNKKIVFAKDESLNNSINSIVLMETGNTHTCDDFLFEYDFEKLGPNDVAISSNIASKNCLRIDSVIYSKNRQSDLVEQYTVKFILPAIYGISEGDISDNKGVVIIGRDSDYLENVQSDFLYFYHEDYSKISENGAFISGELNSVDKTIEGIAQKYLIYFTSTLAIMLLVCVVVFYFLQLFNHNIYLIKQEFGVKGTYKLILKNTIVYYTIILCGSLLMYGLLSIVFWGSIINSTMNVIALSSISYISYVREKRKVQRR